MKYRSTGEVAGGALGGGIEPRISYPRPMISNPTASDLRGRREELTNLLRAAVQYTARELLLNVPPSCRTTAEYEALRDCVRDRRAASPETIAMLLAVQSRADATHRHTLSEQIRALEVGPSLALCPLEASEAEQLHDAELDLAQLAAARHKAPTYWQAVREKAIAHMAALRTLIDATARYVTPSRTA